MSTTTLTPSTPRVNGLDVEALRRSIAAIEADAALGQTRWRVASRWVGGTRTDHHVEGFEIGGEAVKRPFTLKIDEPEELGGTNAYANPQEHLLAALNACMMVGYSAVAALMGVRLTKLGVEIEGDIDLRGFLGLDAAVPRGYTALRQTVHLAGDGTEAQLRKLHEVVQATSPNVWNLTRPVAVTSDLVIE